VVRNETALTLEQELIIVKAERDAVLKERNDLLSRVEQLERYEAECMRMRGLLHQHEGDGLQKAEETIRARDRTIRDMSNRLDKTLDELEMERAQRQRRQIIFPVNGNGANFNEPPNL
jgi:DNA repair ATPase RecN